MVIETDWDARLSTVARRQGRQGRHYDFAQWYPKVVVYDQYGWEEHPLVPAGEFYGEFGNFRVQLDVPEDQVLGATGVPVCGDPGWSGANQDKSRAVEYGVEAYPGIAQQVSGPGPGQNGACAFTGMRRPSSLPATSGCSGTRSRCTTSRSRWRPTTATRAAASRRPWCTCSTSRATRRPGAAWR